RSCQTLLREKIIDNTYIEEILDTTKNLGPYYLIAPKIALIHNKPNIKWKKNCLSFSYFKIPILFENKKENPINYFINLVTRDSISHIELIKQVVNIFSNQIFVNDLETINSIESLITLFKKYKLIVGKDE
ncbi:MAG: hypothetical protein E7Y34_01650, partial [Mycoplasma sp.]|nr:hypothetical protein [Mycoplasma sp.]